MRSITNIYSLVKTNDSQLPPDSACALRVIFKFEMDSHHVLPNCFKTPFPNVARFRKSQGLGTLKFVMQLSVKL